uniref:tetratricopeptide repeat protein n=1 Tax=Parvimonas micra TaxID=33033 RepID=UPI00248EF8F0
NLLIIRGLINLEISDDFIIKIYTKYLLMILDYDNSYYNILINEIKILLSDLESKNEDDYLLNMLYGDLCVKEKFYIKANIFYKKSITNSNKIIDNIINKKIQDITVKVKIEELLQLVDRFKFEDCYKILESIDNFSLDKEDSYWIGYVYNKLNENEKSIEYYEKSLDLNADFLNIFIELGLLYYKIQKIEKSLDIFERGLSIYIDDEKLLFNKIILELKLKRFKKAKEDIEKLLLYEDIDNSIMNDILYLQELYKNELK